MKHKKLSLLLAAAILTAAAATCVTAKDNSIPSITVEGQTVTFPDQKPVIRNNRTLVPIRMIAESLGYDVKWNSENNTAVIDGGRIILYIGTNKAVIDGKERTLDVASTIENNRTMVPLRVIAETFGCTVDWFETNNTVFINPREADGSEMSVFERFSQSGLFVESESADTDYLTWKADTDDYDNWWIERPKDKSLLDNQSLDCSIIMRTFNPEDLTQVKALFPTLYPTDAEEAYSILLQTICGEVWQTFYDEDSEWYPLYEGMPAMSGTFGTTYLDDRQVEMYANNTCTRVTIQISEDGYINPEVPRQLTQNEVDFYTEQAKSRYCLNLWGLK